MSKWLRLRIDAQNCYKLKMWFEQYYAKSYLFGRGSFQRFLRVLLTTSVEIALDQIITVSMESRFDLQQKMGSSSQESNGEWNKLLNSFMKVIEKSCGYKIARDNGSNSIKISDLSNNWNEPKYYKFILTKWLDYSDKLANLYFSLDALSFRLYLMGLLQVVSWSMSFHLQKQLKSFLSHWDQHY